MEAHGSCAVNGSVGQSVRRTNPVLVGWPRRRPVAQLWHQPDTALSGTRRQRSYALIQLLRGLLAQRLDNGTPLIEIGILREILHGRSLTAGAAVIGLEQQIVGDASLLERGQIVLRDQRGKLRTLAGNSSMVDTRTRAGAVSG